MTTMMRMILLQDFPKGSATVRTAVGVIAAVMAVMLISDLLQPDKQLVLVSSLLLRGIALMTCFALHSLAIQITGLVGEQGLHPLGSTLKTLNTYLSDPDPVSPWSSECAMKALLTLVYEKFHVEECVNKHLLTVVWVDVCLAALAVLFPHPILLAYLYLAYYSYKRIAGPFLNYQWDVLLLESLFLSVPLALASGPAITKAAIWAFKWLLFRLMFGSGMVKAYGADPSWHKDYTAMGFHFLTQPLPNRLAMALSQVLTPIGSNVITIATLIAELHLPLLSLCNVRWICESVFSGYGLLQLAILSTGYFGFFNYLTIVLGLCLLSDYSVWWVLGMLAGHGSVDQLKDLTYALPRDLLADWTISILCNHMCSIMAMGVIAISTVCHAMAVVQLLVRCGLVIAAPNQTEEPQMMTIWEKAARGILDSLQLIADYWQRVAYLGNHYGLFANMTKVRNEVLIEVSADQQTWHTLRWKYKPDSIHLPPKRVFPDYHMPRLDWQMWFLAFRPLLTQYPKWAITLLISIAEGNKDVLELLHSSACDTINMLQQQAEQSPGQQLKVRVALVNYTFNAKPCISVLLDGFLGGSRAGDQGAFWSAGERVEILAPSDLPSLYALYEGFFSNAPRSAAPPSVETAQDVIMRTLFRTLLKRREREGSKQE